MKKEVFSASLISSTDDPIRKLTHDVSDWWRLKRITSLVILAVDKFRRLVSKVKDRKEEIVPCVSKSGLISVDLLDRAEKFLIQREQCEAFSKELSDLRSFSKSVKLSSKLVKLDPMLYDGILKVGRKVG